jgi:hypothetical protein
MRKMCCILLATVVLTPPGLAMAQGVAQPQVAFMTLLKEGYEIRATSVVPLVEQATAGATHSPVLVTLQKGGSVAVCQFSWNAWSSLTKAALEDPRLCDVR